MNYGVRVEFVDASGEKNYGDYVSENKVEVYARDIKQVPVASYSDLQVLENRREMLMRDWEEYPDLWGGEEVHIDGIEDLADCETFDDVYHAIGCDGERFMALLTYLGLKDSFFSFVYAHEDPYQEDYDNEWECFLDALSCKLSGEIMKDKSGIVMIMGSNMTWRGVSGFKFIDADRMAASEIVESVTPDTSDFSIDMYDDKDGELRFVVYHHDCPTGSRMRFIPIEVALEYLDKKELLDLVLSIWESLEGSEDERYIYEHVLKMGKSDKANCVSRYMKSYSKERLVTLATYLFREDLVERADKDMLYQFIR